MASTFIPRQFVPNIVDRSGQYPGNVAKANGGKLTAVDGLIVHHTGGDASVDTYADNMNSSHIGTQYIMDRDGTIYKLTPDGTRTNQILPSWGAASTSWANNGTVEGIELIAANDKDVTPAQVQSLTTFAFWHSQVNGYDPTTNVLGHGEVNGFGKPAGIGGQYVRESTEGYTAKTAFEAALPGMLKTWDQAGLSYPPGLPTAGIVPGSLPTSPDDGTALAYQPGTDGANPFDLTKLAALGGVVDQTPTPPVNQMDAATRLAFDPTYDVGAPDPNGAIGPYGLQQGFDTPTPFDAGYNPASGNVEPFGTAGVYDNMMPHPDTSGLDTFYNRTSTTPTPLQQVQSLTATTQAQAQQQAQAMLPGTWGAVQGGNIDLYHRPVVMMPNGEIETVKSANFTNDDGTSVLVPTIGPNGEVLSSDAALAQYKATGQNLGTFKDDSSAEAYAEALHEQQASYYANATPTNYAYGVTEQGPSIDDRDAADVAKLVNAEVATTMNLNGSGSPDDRSTLTPQQVGTSTGYNQLSEAQKLAILALPNPPATPVAPVPLADPRMPPVPQADPRNTPVVPATMPAGLRPNTIPSTADPTAPAKQYVTSKNGHVYEVGSILKSGKDYYKVQPDGTFLKADTPIRIGTGTVAEGVATGLLDNALKQAPGVLSQAGGALSGALGALGGLFSGGSTPYGGNPVPPMDVPVGGSIAWAQQAITSMKAQVAAGPSTTVGVAQAGLDNWMNNGTPTTTVLPTSPTWNSLVGGAAINAGAVATRAAAIPTWQDFMGGNTSPSSILVSPPPVSSSIGTSPSWSDIISGSGNSSPSSKADSWSQPYLDANIPSITAAPSNAASESYAKAATLHDLSADSISGVKVPEYITVSKAVKVDYDKPINTSSDTSAGVSWDPNAPSFLSDGGSFSLDQKPAPVQTIAATRTVNKMVTIKNPAYVAQQTSLQAPPQQEFVAAGTGQQLFPQTVQQFDASTNRFNAVTVYRPAAPTAAQSAAQLAQVRSVVSGQAGNTFASAGNNNASAAAQQSPGGSLTGGSGPSGGSGNGRWA